MAEVRSTSAPATAAGGPIWYLSNRGPGVHRTSEDDRIFLDYKLGGLALLLAPTAVKDAASGRSVHWVCAADTREDKKIGRYRYPSDTDGTKSVDVRMVSMTDERTKGYLNDFSNTALWLTMHGRPHDMTTPELRKAWTEYKAAQRQFASEVIKNAQPGATVIVHDFQLALVPNMIKEARPDLNVAAYWHIPFATPQEMEHGRNKGLPKDIARELTAAMSNNARFGFHSEQWADNFRKTHLQLTGVLLEGQHDGFVVPGFLDPAQVRAKAERAVNGGKQAEVLRRLGISPEAHAVRQKTPRLERPQIAVVVGRGDPKNGIRRALQAYKAVLQDPNIPVKPAMILIATQARPGVPVYDREWEGITNDAKEISNTRGANLVFYEGAPYETTLAAQSLADIALVPSERGGRDLVGIEPVAGRGDNESPVVVVIADGAAAYETLQPGAVVVRNAGPEVSDHQAVRQIHHGFRSALLMSDHEAQHRFKHMRDSVRLENPVAWSHRLEAEAHPGWVLAEGTGPDLVTHSVALGASIQRQGAVAERSSNNRRSADLTL